MVIRIATEPPALHLAQVPECAASSSSIWLGLMSGLALGLFLYAVLDALLFAWILRKARKGALLSDELELSHRLRGKPQ